MSKSEKISELINRVGLTDASKILGLPRYEMVRIVDKPFDEVTANFLLWDLMDDNLLPKSYKNSTIYVNDGIFYWTTKFTDNVGFVEMSTMATPFWDGSKVTPVETDWVLIKNEEGDSIYDQETGGEYFDEIINRTNFDGIEDLLTWYKHFYLPKVYNLILTQFSKFKDDYQ
jgi:hypothetical protein